MFNRKKFISSLDSFEVENPHNISSEEIHAIMDECEKDGDSLYLAVCFGFQCGCMKAGANHE